VLSSTYNLQEYHLKVGSMCSFFYFGSFFSQKIKKGHADTKFGKRQKETGS
jgi:hypothetical protein